MFGKKRKKEPRRTKAEKDISFAVYNVISGQRAPSGERSEMCTGTLNNNRKMATLRMLEDFKD